MLHAILGSRLGSSVFDRRILTITGTEFPNRSAEYTIACILSLNRSVIV